MKHTENPAQTPGQAFRHRIAMAARRFRLPSMPWVEAAGFLGLIALTAWTGS